MDQDEPDTRADAEETGEDVSLTRMQLRDGGWIGYSDDAIFVHEGDGSKLKISHSGITEISLRTLEWGLTVMSVILVGVGAYVTATRNPLVGVGFSAVGLWSCYRSYSKRYELRIRVEDRKKPIAVHPVEPKQCHETLSEVVGLERRE